MTWNASTLNILDAAAVSRPVIAYTDGTNFAFAHPLLSNTGAIISPATADNQATMITSLGTIATNSALASSSALQTSGNSILTAIAASVAGAIPAGTNAIGSVIANAGTNLNTSALALDTSVNGVLVAQGSTTSGQKGPLIQGAVATSSPTLTNGQTNPLSLDTAGNLRVNVVAGGASGGTSSNFAAAFPGIGTAMGAKNGANMVNLTADGANNLNVNLQTAVPAGTNIVGKVGIDQTTPGTTNGVQINAALPAGTNTLGSVNAASNTAGGASSFPLTGLAGGHAVLLATPVAVKASAGNLYGVSFQNPSNADAWVLFYDIAAGSVTVGTSLPLYMAYVPQAGAWEEKMNGECKISFATAITMVAVTTPGGSTAPSSGLFGNVIYK